MNNKNRPLQSSPLILLAFLAFSMNLRAHITAVPSIIGEIQKTYGFNDAAAGLLTGIPVLCFGLLAPLASYLLSRVSLIRGIQISLGGIIISLILRSAGPVQSLFAGTFLLGFSLTMGNILGLMVIAAYFPGMKSLMTGIYVATINMSSMITSAATAPLALRTGWRFSLALWVVFAVAALGLWTSAAEKKKASPRGETNSPQKKGQSPGRPWKQGKIWLLALAFIAHSFLFYGITAWLPVHLMTALSMNISRAGVSASVFQLTGLIGAFVIPGLTHFSGLNSRRQFYLVSFPWLFMALGLLFLPRWWILWTFLGGIGSGGGFTVIFGHVMDLAADLDENRRFSAFVQGIGYCFSSLAPVILGSIREASGSLNAGFITLSGAAVVMTLCGMGATREQRDEPHCLKEPE